jgi:carboxylesterase type B
VRALYGLGGGQAGAAYPPHGAANAQFATDTAFRCRAAAIAAWYSAKYPTFQYEFSRGREPRGAVHSMDLRYVFGILTPDEVDAVDRPISDAVQAYWTNFARRRPERW